MKQIAFLTVLLFSLTSIAQNYDFGKVSKEEIEEKFHPLDSSANAAYLYKNRNTFFEYSDSEGFQLITEVQERIKIYTQEGFQYATKPIGLYKSNSNKEKVTSIKAYTYNFVDGKIEETKLKKDGIFEEERSKYWDETKFTMPNIKEGAVIEYKYRITSPFYSNVDEFVFQHDIPVKKLEAKFEAPEYFNFKVNAKGYLPVIPKTERKRDRIRLTNKDRNLGQTTNISSSEIEFDKNCSYYELTNIPALKEEPYVNNINNYRASVKYELSYTKFPNSPMKFYSTTWEDVVKTIYESPNFGTELNKSGYYEDDIDALVGAVSDPMKRIALIYNFVKSRVKWNGYYGKYCNDGVRKAYKEQTGNVAEINLMLTSMLRHAGLNANPVLVSTRTNGVPLFPTREGYNYVISCVEILDGTVLLDATCEYGIPNVLPYRTLNWEGRIIRKQGSSALVSLYPKENSSQTISMMANLDKNGTIEGACRSVKTSHNALSYREKYNKANEADFLEKLENKYNGLEVSDFKVSNAVDLGKPVMESYKFVKESQADIVGDKIYFSPLFFLRTKENPFKLEKREFPIDFGYPSGSKYMINITLPEGYKVESAPESGAFMLPDGLGAFKYVISANESKVQLVIETSINQPIISAMYYETLKEYFKQLIEKENEQIVLTKV
ncbi:DUF3857 domain-containing protein [Snuella lapsa]|uniref:DUF3857 domain-containing protein n=1 Tax=Snuella lapsa TaxID=870481 RepID=A0ABP6X7T1_9FLAO